MKSREKELWEDLFVVYQVTETGRVTETGQPRWKLVRVINHNAPEDPSAPRRITHAELENGLLRGDVITAYSKQEAMLKHAASGRGGDVWSIKSSLVSEWLYGRALEREYTIVKEDF